MINLLLKVFGDPNDRKIKKILPVVDYINALEPDMIALSDEALRAKTAEFKQRIANRKKDSDPVKDRELEKEILEQILPEAFAVVREAGKRVLNMRHFDVQLIGGIVLHQGQIAEMRTGEGKTLVATLPAYLNALAGKGVHVVTVNDYLAKRDSEWMGRIYKFLGLTVGLVLSDRSHDEFERKKAAYAADITYGTNNEFGFDYLRDNMAGSLEQCVQRPFYHAIIDEVDSILIDEARTPLIISGRLERSAETYKVMASLAPMLIKDLDYTLEEKQKNIVLTEEGIDKAQELLKVPDLFDPSHQYAHYLIHAIKAKEIYRKDIDYVIKNGEIIIVDEFTGRLMDGRRWSDGLHQAVEAKENVPIQDETQTMASITFQNLFRIYPKLSGMTGTALTEEAEFGKIYSLEVAAIPTNKNDIRVDHADIIYKTEKKKYDAVVDEIEEFHKSGRPILVGTVSIEKSEYISELLKRKGLNHHVLNAKKHENEAYIIAQAGRKGAITIATNMAGRGTDILLGGNAEYLARDMMVEKNITHENTSAEEYEKIKNKCLEDAYVITQKEHEEVVAAGGLYVIGTERHESRRIDNQLRGRAGRQGDPGSTRFFLSLEDNLMRIFGGDKVTMLMTTLGIDEDTAIESSIVSRTIQNAQKKVETYHFDMRKQVLEYDDVMNQQRELFYKQRRKVIEGENIYQDIVFMIEKEAESIVGTYLIPEAPPAEYLDEDLESIVMMIKSVIPQIENLDAADIKGLKYSQVCEKIKNMALEAYKTHENEIIYHYNEVMSTTTHENEQIERQAYGQKDNIMRSLERDILLRIVDTKWVDHLHNIDLLKEGIGLRAYGQKDPLIEYKREAFDLFNTMMRQIQRETVAYLFRSKFEIQIVDMNGEPIYTDLIRDLDLSEDDDEEDGKVINIDKNTVCPCGSGLRYKKCCGKNKK
ncbi:MAG: preprotein translocase subunit SecA [bacterium]